jgi:hypothetical protein
MSVAHSHDTMVLAGKRMIYYSTEALTSLLKNFNQDIRIV